MKLKRGKSVRARIWYDTLRSRRATKALRCFITLTLTLFQIPPLRQPKDSGQRKNARGMSARRVITMSVLFRHIFTKQPNPPRPRKSLGWGVVCRLVLAWV